MLTRMWQVYYWTTLVAWMLSIAVRRKQYRIYGINFLMIIGVLVPLLLYFANLSSLIDTDISNNFYYIFTCVNIIMIIYSLTTDERLPRSTSNSSSIALVNNRLDIVNIAFIALYELETFLLSGLLAPAMQAVDIHTGSYPILDYLTRNLAVPALIDVICYSTTKKKRFIVYIAILVLLPIITRNARMVSFQTAISIVILYLAMHEMEKSKDNKSGESHQKGQRDKRVFRVLVACVLAVLLLFYSAYLTNKRTIDNGAKNYDYAESTGYLGPFGNVGAVYYGYFPLSYNNLNLRLKYDTPQHNYLGPYSFTAVWFGVFQIDNVFGISPTQDVDNRIITNPSATVPTAFWTYWYDYGYACFIPVVAMIISDYYMLVRYRKTRKFEFLLIYSYLSSGIFLESFQNTYFSAAVVWGVVFILAIFKSCIFLPKVSMQNTKADNNGLDIADSDNKPYDE